VLEPAAEVSRAMTTIDRAQLIDVTGGHPGHSHSTDDRPKTKIWGKCVIDKSRMQNSTDPAERRKATAINCNDLLAR
jgi:hypothetical protein